ncbi:hypothetical protein, partial [Streptococcus equinus]|uniref:hypothetical protein n=1 Tax=Streptococcus equinus TaxID=1335 RepID=UPI00237B8095
LANLFYLSGMFCLLYLSIANPELLIVALFIIGTKLFGVGQEKIGGLLPDKFELFILVFSYSLWIWRKPKRINKDQKIYLLLLYTIFIIISAAVMAYITIGQSILIGIVLQARIITILSVIPIISLMNDNLSSYERLWNQLKNIALLQSLINIFQLLLYPQVKFLTITSENIRFGSIRIGFGGALITIALLMTFSELVKNVNKKNIIYFMVYMFYLLFVRKTRVVIFGVLISILVVFVLSLRNKSGWRRAFLLGICFLLMSPFAAPRISELFDLTQQEVSTNSGNYVARTGEVEFYTSQVKNPVFGRGYISPKIAGGELYDTRFGYYSITDIGIIALYVINGIVGLIWFFILMVIIMERSKKSRYGIFAIEYLIYSIATCMTLLSCYYESEGLILSLILLASPKLGEKNRVIVENESGYDEN